MNTKIVMFAITTTLAACQAWSLQSMDDNDLAQTTGQQGISLLVAPSVQQSLNNAPSQSSQLAQTWSNIQNQLNQLLGQIPVQMNVVLGPISDSSTPTFLADGSLLDSLNMTMSSLQFQNIKVGSTRASVLSDNTIPSIGSISLTNIHVQGTLHMTYLP